MKRRPMWPWERHAQERRSFTAWRVASRAAYRTFIAARATAANWAEMWASE